MKKNILTLFFLFSIVLFFSIMFFGCSAYSDLFLINSKDDTISVIIKLKNNLDEVIADSNKLQLRCLNKETEVDDNTFEDLNQKLKYETIDSTTIKIVLPAHSTTLLGGGSQGPTYFDSFEFRENSKIISNNEMSKMATKSGGLFPPFHYSFTIK